MTASHPQEEINRAVYYSPRVYRYYLSRSLTPQESACLARHRSAIQDRDVLDIGVGAGRTAHHLSPVARRYEAIDYSPVMVAYIRENMPWISVRQADFRDLSVFPAESFDFVFATDNVIDALSHEHRLGALGEVKRVLRPGGIFAFSSHNLHYKRALAGPSIEWSSNPARLAVNCAKYAVSWWNHLRIGRLRETTPDYALLNDRGHFYACLHYYIARAAMRSQLAAHGLRFVEAIDTNGCVLSDGADDGDHASLMYVAENPEA